MPTEEEIQVGIEAVRNWEWQNHRAVILPYVESNLAVFPEDFLARMYYRLKAEGTLAMSFPGMDVAHLNKFISYMSSPRLGFVICCLKTPKKPHPVGWGFLTECDGPEGGRKASFGFGFFKEIHGRREHVDLSMFMLGYWFKEFQIDQLYGTTLNPLALNYSKRFGFERLCVLPKFFSGRDANLITLTPETFLPYYSSWKMAATPPPAIPALTSA